MDEDLLGLHPDDHAPFSRLAAGVGVGAEVLPRERVDVLVRPLVAALGDVAADLDASGRSVATWPKFFAVRLARSQRERRAGYCLLRPFFEDTGGIGSRGANLPLFSWKRTLAWPPPGQHSGSLLR